MGHVKFFSLHTDVCAVVQAKKKKFKSQSGRAKTARVSKTMTILVLLKHHIRNHSTAAGIQTIRKLVTVILLLVVGSCYLNVAAFRGISSWTSSATPRLVVGGIRRVSKQSNYGFGLSMSSSSSTGIQKDVLIVGGGLAGLSAALHIATTTNQRQVTVVDAMPLTQDISKSTSGSFAAAGMLAPQSERLLPGPYLDLCLKSRSIYPNFVSKVESLAKDYFSSWCDEQCTNSHQHNYLLHNEVTKLSTTMKPWEVGFLATGGFIAPAFAGTEGVFPFSFYPFSPLHF